MKEYYDILGNIDTGVKTQAVTVISGASTGEKALLKEGEPVWMADPSGCIAQNTGVIASAAEDGVVEAGKDRIFVETIGSTKKLVICGGGHVSMPVIRIGKMIGMQVCVLEDRQEFADNALQAGADEAICRNFVDALKEIPGDRDTYFVIVTRGHSFDKECLREIAGKPHAYIGMIGSHRKNEIVISGLKAEGISAEVLESVHAPIGLSIGARTPEEIGVSIMAEIISVKNTHLHSVGYQRDILKAIAQSYEEKSGKVLCTIVSKSGSAPREIGSKMLVDPEGRIVGTVGGGLGEAQVIRAAVSMLKNGTEHQLISVDMTAEAAAKEGLICGGTIEVFLEKI